MPDDHYAESLKCVNHNFERARMLRSLCYVCDKDRTERGELIVAVRHVLKGLLGDIEWLAERAGIKDELFLRLVRTAEMKSRAACDRRRHRRRQPHRSHLGLTRQTFTDLSWPDEQ